MKTINVVCDYSSVYAGNFIPSIFKLVSSLKQDNQVIISLPSQAEKRSWATYLKGQGIKLCFFDNTSSKRIIKTVKQINKTNSANTIYTHFISTPVAKLIAGVFKKNKLVIHVHSDFSCGQNSKSIKDKFKRFLFEKLIRKDASFIFVSNAMKEISKIKKSYYVQNALCVERILSSNNKSISFDKNKTNILAFAWSPEVKGIDITCEAFLELKDEYKNNSILNIVTNENEKNKCRDFILNKTCIDVEKQKNIVLLDPQEDIFSLYKQSDIFISSSRSEGFSYSILEALYFGLNVCSSNIDGTVWSEKYGAHLFDLHNPSELTSLLEDIMKNNNNKSIREDISHDFSIEEWSKNISYILLN